MSTAASTWSATLWNVVVHSSRKSAPPRSTPRAASASSSPIWSQRSSSSSAVSSAKSTVLSTSLRRGQPAEPVLHAEVEVAVVDRAALPAHPADQSDRLHARQSVPPRCARVSRVPRVRSGGRQLAVDLVLGGLGARLDHQLVDVRRARAGWRSRRSRRRRPRRPAARRRRRTPRRPSPGRRRSGPARTRRCAPCPGAISLIRIGSPTQLEPQRLGDDLGAVLGRGVAGAALVGDPAGRGADVDDQPVAAGPQRGQQRLGDVEQPEHVDVVHPAPVVAGRPRRPGRQPNGAAGVVDQHVQAVADRRGEAGDRLRRR